MSVRGDGVVVCFGEMLLRLAAPGAQLLLQTPALDVCYGGAEANVAVSLARLGGGARMVSVVPANALGRAAREELRRYGVDVSTVTTAPGRMGLYFLSPGAGARAGEVIYDRAGSAFAIADFAGLDWRAAFEGAGWFHVSGITAALGQACADAAIAAAAAARAAGLTVSFDCNYRAKLWESWKGDGPAILRQLAGLADIVFGDHRDMGLMLGGDLGGEDKGRAAAAAAFAAFPALQRMTSTQRTEHSVNHHELAAVMYARDAAWRAPGVNLTHIVDRIGGGDAYAAGIIHALRRGWNEDKALGFALAAAALKHVTPGDFALATEADVNAVSEGASVRR